MEKKIFKVIIVLVITCMILPILSEIFKSQKNHIFLNDKIFTFIINPTSRRIKAITQLIYNTQNQKLLENKDFLRFLENICVTDCHTYPYFLQYETIMDKTLFLPLDHEKFTAKQILQQYFTAHCQELSDKEFVKQELYANKADYTKKAIYNKVSANLKPLFFEAVFQKDFDLYQKTLHSVETDLSRHIVSKYDK